MVFKRSSNTRVGGGAFSSSEIDAVWKKGRIVTGKDPDTFRTDSCGALMRRDHYGDTSSSTGWEVDHIKPVAAGGGDELANLQPLQWENNRHKGDDYPQWTCKVR